ncbi:VRR-NUC domain-containing protein [Litorivicinus lipolyticus]|uniref:VRR-NUC domain-containing protein n=1 Tax=Litorivicinus lipolyticus TaxID=418701 RepID=UPI003B5C3F6B
MILLINTRTGRQLPLIDPPAERYYLNNLQRALDWLRRCPHAAALCPLIDQFEALPVDTQALLVRLIMRQKAHFRVPKLNYPEIIDMAHALDAGCQAGWLSLDHDLTLGELGDLLSAAELRARFGADAGVRKGDLLMHLQHEALPDQPWDDWVPDLSDSVVSLTCRDTFDRWRLAFFGSLYHDWQTFVLEQLGVMRYQDVELVGAGFESALEFEQCWQISQWDGLQPLPADPAGPLASRRRSSALYARGRERQRLGQWDLALDDYRASNARPRIARVLEQRGDLALAYRFARRVVARPHYPAEATAVAKSLPRLAKAVGYPAPARARNSVPTEAMVLAFRPNVRVETAVAEALSADSGQAFWVENGLFPSLFGLLFWDALFAPRPGAFFHPFQSAPADLYSSDFESSRQTLIDQAFASLDDDSHRVRIRQRAKHSRGIQNRLVNWSVLTPPLLELALDCLPADDLAVIFRRLLDDIKRHRSGFPDLIVFDSSARSYRLVEVKGPGDALQDHQRAWLGFFNHHRIDATVVNVSWA